MRIMNCGPYTVNLFAAGASRTIVYIVMGQEDAQTVWAMLEEPKPALAAISGVDWNRELSPWCAPKAFRGGDEFGGGGPALLSTLAGQIVPLVKKRLGYIPQSSAIAGYSLAGLFALWSAFNTDTFDRVASVSGSLWFDGFLDYVATNIPCGELRHVYLSLGNREKDTRNPRMAVVEDCTRKASGLLQGRGIPVTFEITQGGHFDNPPARIARGITELLKGD